jgi:hypothetical protein
MDLGDFIMVETLLELKRNIILDNDELISLVWSNDIFKTIHKEVLRLEHNWILEE